MFLCNYSFRSPNKAFRVQQNQVYMKNRKEIYAFLCFFAHRDCICLTVSYKLDKIIGSTGLMLMHFLCDFYFWLAFWERTKLLNVKCPQNAVDSKFSLFSDLLDKSSFKQHNFAYKTCIEFGLVYFVSIFMLSYTQVVLSTDSVGNWKKIIFKPSSDSCIPDIGVCLFKSTANCHLLKSMLFLMPFRKKFQKAWEKHTIEKIRETASVRT